MNRKARINRKTELARRTRLRRRVMRYKAPREGTVRWYEKRLDSLTAQINKMRCFHRCVQCNSTFMIDCGHIFTRKLRATRWDISEDGNCQAQCRACNTAHIAWPERYMTWYSEKFGPGALGVLRDRAYSGRTFTDEELRLMVTDYEAKLAELRSEIDCQAA